MLLTGMGRDGALGPEGAARPAATTRSRRTRRRSAVYGMPKAAAALDAAVDILPLGRIAPRLRALVVRNGSERSIAMTSASERHDRCSATPAPIRAHGIMVLLVDDQAMVGEAVRRALLDEPDIDFHYLRRSAPRPSRSAERIKPTVILQDLVMPGIDGLSLVRAVPRRHPATSDIPIIVLSTKEEPTVKSDAFAAGANDYLVKLPDQIELVARIRYHSKAY